MGYYVRKLQNRSAETRNWKLQFVSCKRCDAVDPNAKNPRRTKDIPKSEFRSLGFHEHMTFKEAREWQKQINSQATLKRYEEIRQGAKQKLEEERLGSHALFPEIGLVPNVVEIEWLTLLV